MATSVEKQGRGGNELAYVYGHDSKKFRLRAVSGEKDIYSKFINKSLTKKLSWGQLFLSVLICITQVITISLVSGRFNYYDATAEHGMGIWSSIITTIAALQTLWCLRSAKYWKLHLSFALHIFCMLGTMVLLTTQLCSTIPGTRYKISNALYDNEEENDYDHNYRREGYFEEVPETLENGTIVQTEVFHKYYMTPYHVGVIKEKVSVECLIASLAVNGVMTTAGIFQLIGSFLMTMMTGRAICCAQSKMHGKLFELEVAGSENSDGMAIFRKLQNNKRASISSNGSGSSGTSSPNSPVAAAAAAPPPYCESLVGII